MRTGIPRLLDDIVALRDEHHVAAAPVRGRRHERVEVLLLQVRQARRSSPRQAPRRPHRRHRGRPSSSRSLAFQSSIACSRIFFASLTSPPLSRRQARTQQRHHVFGLRIAPEHLLLEDELAVDVHVEDAADSRHDLDAADALFELLENLRRQTDGVRQRASGDAVLDANARAFGHAHARSSTCFSSQSRMRFHESIWCSRSVQPWPSRGYTTSSTSQPASTSAL